MQSCGPQIKSPFLSRRIANPAKRPLRKPDSLELKPRNADTNTPEINFGIFAIDPTRNPTMSDTEFKPMPYPAGPPTLKTENLLLRKIERGDLEHIFEGLSDPEVVRYYGVSYDTIEDAEEQMTFFENLEKDASGAWWAICDLGDQTFLGAAGINGINRQHERGEIGFWLLPTHWGRGIMKEVLPTVCRYGFESLGLHRLEAFVESENKSCKRLMKKSGFYHEGTMRDSERKMGKFISIEIYAMLQTDDA